MAIAPPGTHFVTPDGQHYVRFTDRNGAAVWTSIESPQQLAEVQRVYGDAVAHPMFGTWRVVANVSNFLGPGVIRTFDSQSGRVAPYFEEQQQRQAASTPNDDALDQDAFARVQGVLRQFDLESLTDWAQEMLRNPQYGTDYIIQQLRETPEYKQRFGRVNDGRRAAGLPALSETEIITFETQVRQMMRAAGLPPDFYNQPDDFVSFMVGDVSPAEIQTRINDAYLRAATGPAEARAELRRIYGVNEGQMVAFFLDPDRALPLIQQQWQAASVSGAAVRSGYGGLDRTEAERLAQLGVDEGQAAEGFGTLQAARELFTALPGEDAETISRQDQQNAIFGGDAEQRERIARRAGARVSQGSGGQGFALAQGGVAGLGADG